MKAHNIAVASPVPHRSLTLLLAVALLLQLAACQSTPPPDEQAEGQEVAAGEPLESTDHPSPDPSDPSDPIPSDNIYPSPEANKTPAADGGGGAARNGGKFLFEYRPPTTPAYADIREVLQRSRVLEQLAESLNKELALPVDVTLATEQCGAVNAFYNPQARRLSLCYELVNRFADMYQKIEGQSEEEFISGIFSAMVLVMYHEIGHALVDVFDIKTPGRPEDVVDQLAVFMLLKEGGDQGARMAMRGARYFALSAQQRGADDIAFWDEHSTDETRFFNIYCWIYGSNKDKYTALVDSGILPAQRAARCTEEYSQLSEGWNRLLRPHLK